jgi:transcription elongation GreA/GreB family factor
MSRAFVKEDAQPAPVLWRKATEGLRAPLTLSGARRLRQELQQLRDGPSSDAVAQRITSIEQALSGAEIVDARTLAGPRIKLGATVVLQDVDSGLEARYQIVGEVEADLKAGRIAVASPLGRALIGREVGELVAVQAPGGSREYEILDLQWREPDEETQVMEREK